MSESDNDKPRRGKPGESPRHGPDSRPPRAGRPGGAKPAGGKPRAFKPREGAAMAGRDGERPRGDRPPGGRPAPSGDFKPKRSYRPRPAEGAEASGERPPRRDFSDRPPRSRDARPGQSRDGQDRPFRPRPPRDAESGPTRRDFGDRPDRETGAKPFRPRQDRAFGDRARQDRPPRDGDTRPPRRDGGDRPDRPRRDFSDRPKRDFGDKPPRGFADRPPRDARAKPFRPRNEGRDRAPAPASPGTAGLAEGGERIARVIARAGLCSRRDAEEWIAAGRVNVNGTIIDSPALDIGPHDRVFVDGKPLPERELTRLWLYHKPRGLVTTAADPEGRPTVFDNLPPGLPRVMSVGRLDINTEGLMLLTNDGGLTKVLAHPETGWLRRYRVRVHGHVEQSALDGLKDGISLDGIDYGPIGATLEREIGENAWLTIDLREGKNREIKRVLEHLGLLVNRLIRVSFGPFQLDDLGEGAVEEVRTRTLKEQLGARLIEESGAWFEGPRRGSVAEEQAMLATPPKPKRFDRRKPGEKRDLAILGEAPDLKVTREKVADRRGRKVQVERIVRVEPPAEPAREESRGKPFRSRDDRPPRQGGDRPFGSRPPRDEAGGERPFRSRPAGERSPRSEGERPFRPRPPRDAEGAPARSFRPRPEGERPARQDGDRPYRPRPPRDGDRPAGERPFRARPEGDRPPRRDGDRPFKPRPPGDGAKASGDRPFRGKPGGPGGGKPFGGRPSGGKPFGGRPGGGKRPPRDRG